MVAATLPVSGAALVATCGGATSSGSSSGGSGETGSQSYQASNDATVSGSSSGGTGSSAGTIGSSGALFTQAQKALRAAMSRWEEVVSPPAAARRRRARDELPDP